MDTTTGDSFSDTRVRQLPSILCRGEPATLASWVRDQNRQDSIWKCVAIITAGCMAYGFTLGLWRAPLMAVFVAVKLPLLIFLTILANGLINGMFAQILGTGLSFRQTLHTILISFTTFSVIVGALSPVTLFMALNMPDPAVTDDALRWHGFNLLIHTLLIAYAGILANLKMLRLLSVFSGNKAASLRTFAAWTVGNLFLGAQLAYVLRPFFGNPAFDVQFLRPDPLNGNFYLVVFDSITNVMEGNVGALFLPAFLLLLIVGVTIGRTFSQEIKDK